MIASCESCRGLVRLFDVSSVNLFLFGFSVVLCFLPSPSDFGNLEMRQTLGIPDISFSSVCYRQDEEWATWLC